MKKVIIFLVLVTTLFAENNFRQISSHENSGVYIREIESEQFSRTYEYKIDPISVTTSAKDGYSSVQLGSSPLASEPGAPMVPFVSQTFVIPMGSRLDSISYESGDLEVQTLEAPILFANEPIPLSQPGVETKRNDSIYASSQLYPRQVATVSSVQKTNGVSVAFLSLTPVQFTGATNELTTTHSITLTLHFSPMLQSRSSSAPIHPERVDTDLLGIENPEDLSGFRTMRSSTQAEAQFLIITGEEFLDPIVPHTVKDLADRRRAQGMSVKIVTTDSIYNNVNASLDHTPDGEIDRQMKIRYFISEAHKNWGTEYVLLAGDTNVIPVRILNPNFNHPAASLRYDRDLPSDYYYQCLDGAYNSIYKSHKGDQRIWGSIKGAGKVIDTIVDQYGKTVRPSIDILPEVYLGRIPAKNPLMFSNWLSKQFTYESIPHDADRNRDILIAGEYAGFINEYVSGYDIMEYTKNSLEQMRIGGLYDSYTTKGFDAFPEIRVETIYDKDREDAGLERWGMDEILEKINSDRFGVIQHIGHSLPKYHLHLTSNDVKYLTNTRPFMINTQSCLAGRFTEDCIAENLLMDSDVSGIWAGIFNTGYGYAENHTTDGNSQRINRNFWDGYFKDENPIVRLGKLNVYGQSGLYFRTTYSGGNNPSKGLYSIFSLHLLGDPTAELKLVRPALDEHLYLTSPVGGQTVLSTKSQKIKWNTSLNELVTLRIIDQSGISTDVGTAMSSDREFQWTPTDVVTAGSDYRMIITSASIADTSTPFTISETIALEVISYPNEGINKQETTTISWNSDDTLVAVWVTLDGAPAQCLSEGTANSSIEWTVPQTLMGAKGYQIRLIGSSSRDRYVESEKFEILPDIITTFPYIEDFETAEHKSYVLPEFWEQSVYDDFDWKIYAGINRIKEQCLVNPEWPISGPSIDLTTKSDSGKYCFIFSREASRGKKFAMLSPVFDLTGCTGSSLSFGLHMYGSLPQVAGEFKIEVIREGKEDTLIFLQDTVIAEDKWVTKEVSLAPFDGETITLRFIGVSGHAYSSDIAVDDITVTVDDQAVSVLEDNPNSTVITNELFVFPSVVTSGVQEVSIYHKNREPFDFRWSLYDAVGNILIEGEGHYYGDGSPVDRINIAPQQRYTGSSVLFLEAVGSDGTKNLYKTYVGFKQ